MAAAGSLVFSRSNKEIVVVHDVIVYTEVQ